MKCRQILLCFLLCCINNTIPAQDFSAGIILHELFSYSKVNYENRFNVIHQVQLHATYLNPSEGISLGYFSLNSGFFIPDRSTSYIWIDSMDNSSVTQQKKVNVKTGGYNASFRLGVCKESMAFDNVTYFFAAGAGIAHIRMNYEIPEFFMMSSPIPQSGTDNIYKTNVPGVNLSYGVMLQKVFYRLHFELGLNDWILRYNTGMDAFARLQIFAGAGISVPLVFTEK